MCVLWIDRKCKLFLYFLKRIIPVAQIPQCNGPISHNVPFCNRYVHIPDAKWCIVGYLTNALWGWCHGSIQRVKECTKSVSALRKCHLQNLWLFCPGCNFVLITEHIIQVFSNFDEKLLNVLQCHPVTFKSCWLLKFTLKKDNTHAALTVNIIAAHCLSTPGARPSAAITLNHADLVSPK